MRFLPTSAHRQESSYSDLSVTTTEYGFEAVVVRPVRLAPL
jgi:hypothetical protein